MPTVAEVDADVDDMTAATEAMDDLPSGIEGTTDSAADESTQDTTSSDTPVSPTDPNLAAADRRAQTATPAADPTNQWSGVREAASKFGYRFDPSIQDDNAALAHLIQSANRSQQADYYSQVGRQLAPHAAKIQDYLAKEKAPAARPAWEAPEIDERWSSLVERDPVSGFFIGKPGTPAAIVDKVNEYAEWKSNYDRNPSKVLNDMVEVRARTMAEQVYEERFAAQEQQRAVSDIQRANADWLYSRDPNGNPIRGNGGRFVPTPAGARYLEHVNALSKMGVTDPRHQDQLARERLQLEIHQATQAQAADATGQATKPQTAAARTAPNVNGLGTLPPSQRQVTPGAPEVPTSTGLSLAEKLRRDIEAEGYTDADFENPYGTS